MKKISFGSLLPLLFIFFLEACSSNGVKIDKSFDSYFQKENVEGMFALLNNQRGTVTLNNLPIDTQRVAPGSIFKIVETIIGLESQVVNDDKSNLGDSAGVNLKDGFRNDDTAFIVLLSEKIGKEKMSFWLDSLHYGNANVTNLSNFWYNGDLLVSPDEQLGLLSKIYFDQLPVQKYAQGVLRELMLQEDNTKFRLSYTTGEPLSKDGMGWTCGWVEENGHVYFYIATVKNNGKHEKYGNIAQKIAHNILVDQGFFQGKK